MSRVYGSAFAHPRTRYPLFAIREPGPAPDGTFRIHHLPLYSIQMVAKPATIIYGGRRDGAKVKREKGLSDGFQIVAILRDRKVRRCPSPAALFSETAARRRSACLPSAAATHGKRLGKSLAKKGGGLPAWSEGFPDDENSRRRTRYLRGSRGRRQRARACLNGKSTTPPTTSIAASLILNGSIMSGRDSRGKEEIFLTL
jgi:hypothetical protein